MRVPLEAATTTNTRFGIGHRFAPRVATISHGDIRIPKAFQALCSCSYQYYPYHSALLVSRTSSEISVKERTVFVLCRSRVSASHGESFVASTASDGLKRAGGSESNSAIT